MKRPAWLALAVLSLAALAPVHAHAADAIDNYPAKPVRVLVPVTAGGGVDNIARLVMGRMRDALGQPFVVENKPGAGGNIGLSELAKSAPDGYTIAVVPNTLTINQTLMSNLPFDAIKSFAPVILLGNAPVVMAGRSTLAQTSLKELIASAKAEPSMTYAGCDTGSVMHLAGEIFKQQAGIDLVHVPYKGCSDSVPNVLGGQVDLLFITYPNVASYFKDGRLRAYAVAADKRLPYAPDIPTGIEQGVPGFVADAWYGVLAPAGTPPGIIAKLNAALNKVLKMDDVKAAMATIYITPVGGTPEQFRENIRSDIDRYGGAAKKANIHLE